MRCWVWTWYGASEEIRESFGAAFASRLTEEELGAAVENAVSVVDGWPDRAVIFSEDEPPGAPSVRIEVRWHAG